MSHNRAYLRVNQIAQQIASGASKQQANKIVTSAPVSEHGVQVIVINNPPVNSWNIHTYQQLRQAYDQAMDNPAVKAIVITGKGGFFMAGADITYMQASQNQSENTAQLAEVKKNLKEFLTEGIAFCDRMESGKKPVVAACNGPALGGGLELAMSCHARLSVPKAQFGLPELTLGLIPGMGGTQRLPRLIGLPTAVDITLRSSPINAKKAHELGLVDEIVSDPKQLLAAASKYALELASGARPVVRALLKNDKIGTVEAGLPVIQAARNKIAKDHKLKVLPQNVALLDAIEEGLRHGGVRGEQKEIEIMSELVLSPTAKGLIHTFLAQRATSKLPGVDADKAPAGKIRTVAVLGGGTMGSGIAALYVLRGYNVILKEVNQKFLDAGLKRVADVVLRDAQRRKLSADAVKELQSRMKGQLDYTDFDKVDLVIEAVIEDIALKQKIFVDLEKVCRPDCILSTNTSTIDIDLIAKLTRAQPRVLGLHFFSPAHVMPLLEIVRTNSTSNDVLAVSMAMCKKINKTGVVVGNCVGFTANRAFFPYGQAASLLVDFGVSPYEVDGALLKFGMPMGVFQMSDLSGIDVFAHVNGMINSAYGARCYNSTLGHQLAKAGRLGQKTGSGYYNYANKKTEQQTDALAPFVKQAREDAGNPKLPFKVNDQVIQEIVLFPIVNESLRIVAEGHVLRSSDVDICSIMGYGFPSYRGGVIFWGKQVGFKHIANRLRQFADTLGAQNPKIKAFFEPCEYLQQVAQSPHLLK